MLKRTVLILCLCSISACGVFQHEAADIPRDNTAMSAASKKILISDGFDVPGHSKINTLGTVEGRCEKDPQGNTQAIPGDNMRAAAYRQYGDRVDAITGAHRWFVPTGDETGAVDEPGSHKGYWECGGTAVSFTPSPRRFFSAVQE